jgi:hypothetical protein
LRKEEEPTLFEMPKKRMLPCEVLPVSVIDVAPQSSGRRRTGGHDSDSSRREYSHFPREVGSLCCDLFLRRLRKSKSICFDPFAGWGERASIAKEHGISYVGYDINPEAIQAAADDYGASNVLADSRTATIPRHGGLLTCPPYWNLEEYSGQGIDGCPTWYSFVGDYAKILRRCCGGASPGATYCIMVGDWRAQKGYYNMAHTTRTIMYEMGATTIDEVVVSRKAITKIKVMLPQALSEGYTVKVHEHLLVFRLPGDSK